MTRKEFRDFLNREYADTTNWIAALRANAERHSSNALMMLSKESALKLCDTITALRSALSAAQPVMDSESLSRVTSAARAYAEYTVQDEDEANAIFRACDSLIAVAGGSTPRDTGDVWSTEVTAVRDALKRHMEGTAQCQRCGKAGATERCPDCGDHLCNTCFLLPCASAMRTTEP